MERTEIEVINDKEQARKATFMSAFRNLKLSIFLN